MNSSLFKYQKQGFLVKHFGLKTKTLPVSINHVEPPCWWIGFNEQTFQILIHGLNIGLTEVAIDNPNITLNSIEAVENKNYLFLNLTILPDAVENEIEIKFTFERHNIFTINYPLLQRKQSAGSHAGFNAADTIYLLMPDRFCDGDSLINNKTGWKDKCNRSIFYARHGGNIAGIICKLDYLADLGITTLWSTPLLENNMPEYSYHGYACTNFYEVDKRYGTNDDYVLLSAECHKRGLKIIQDFVFNHCGSEHWFMHDMPTPDWFHNRKQFGYTNNRAAVLFDIHASNYDKDSMSNGWFVPTMPDFNQQNKFVENYLTQNSIWWTEIASLNGIRMDTQPYADKEMMSRWAKRMLDEYPNFNIVGEAWQQTPLHTYYWQKDAKNYDGYNSNFPAIFDFPLMFAINKSLNEVDSMYEGVGRLFDILAQDFIYADAAANVIFLDNHDTARTLSNVNLDIDKFKMAIAILLTMRGIPQIYYGDEILMDSEGGNDDGYKRKDFPGGWSTDKINYFTPEGRKENPAVEATFNYIKLLLHWRKSSNAIVNGQLMHFVPDGNVYVYFRYTEKDCVMVLVNNNLTKTFNVNTKKYAERMAGYKTGKNVATGEFYNNLYRINIPAKTVTIIELQK